MLRKVNNINKIIIIKLYTKEFQRDGGITNILVYFDDFVAGVCNAYSIPIRARC